MQKKNCLRSHTPPQNALGALTAYIKVSTIISPLIEGEKHLMGGPGFGSLSYLGGDWWGEDGVRLGGLENHLGHP